MQHTEKRWRRVLSSFLAVVMTLTILPSNILVAGAVSSASTGFTEDIEAGKTVKLDINLANVNNGAAKIYSRRTAYNGKGLGNWLGRYSYNGIEGLGYCGNHDLAANNHMTVALDKSTLISDPLAANVYFNGFTDAERAPGKHTQALDRWVTQFFGPFMGGWSEGLTQDEWEKATQMAIWMSLGDLYIEGMMKWNGTGLESAFIDSQYADVVYTSKGHHDSYTGGEHKNSEPAQLRIIKAANALYTWGTYLTANGVKLNERKIGASNIPMEAPFFNTRGWGSGNVLDFHSAAENGQGTIADAFDTTGGVNGVYQQNINGKDYYVVYWMFTSETQCQLGTQIEASGTNVPAGTIISGLTNEDVAMFPELAKVNSAAHPTAIGNPVAIYPGQVKNGTGFVSNSTTTFIDLETGKKDSCKFCSYFKVCVPVDGVVKGKEVNMSISMVNPKTLQYKCYLGKNMNTALQPFFVGDTVTSVNTLGTMKWGGNESTDYKIEVYKEDADSGKRLSGATFEATNADYNKTFTAKSNGNGVATFTIPDNYAKTAGGAYTTWKIREVAAPAGYTPSTQTLSVTLSASGAVGGPFIMKNTKTEQPHDTIAKVDTFTGRGVAGAMFHISSTGTGYNMDISSGTNGSVPIQWWDSEQPNYLAPGTYSVTETAPPPGYLAAPANERTKQITLYYNAVTNEATHSGELVFRNAPTTEFVVVKKDGSNGPLPGAKFELYIDGALADTGVTDNMGEIVFDQNNYAQFIDSEKDSWTVRVVETDAPDGFLVNDPNYLEMEVHKGDDTKYFTFINTKYPEIVIEKRDKETGDTLPDATFQIKIDGTDFEAQKTTDGNGQIHITYEEYGRFLDEGNKDNWTITVTEIKAPAGYNKDFQGTGDYTQTQQLKFGQQLTTFLFEDTSYRSIKVTKKDAETDWPLAGAEFTLESQKLDGGGTVKRTLTTDETGFVVFEDVPNGTYKLWESAPPKGYASNEEVKTVVVTSADDPIIEFTYRNQPHSGILIKKVDAVTQQPIANALFKIEPMAPLTDAPVERKTDENGIIVLENMKPGTYKITELSVPGPYVLNSEPQLLEVKNTHDAFSITIDNYAEGMLYIQKLDSVTQEPLAGAYFDVHTAGGTKIATVGPTGPNGYATLPGLKPGSYVVKEVKAPPGHVIDPVPQSFEVKETDSGKIYVLIFDDKPTSNMWLRKYDQLTGIGLEGAVFKITKADGSLVRENAHSGPDGFIKVNDLDEGAYIVTETMAPTGYILDPTPRNIFLRHNVTEIIDIANVKPGSIAIRKVDAKTKEPLAGAKFAIYSIDDRLLATQTTGADGYARFTDLEAGYYVIKELQAPDGYAVSDTPVKVEVEKFKTTEYEWANGQNATLTILKRDKETQVPLKGATFEVRTMTGELAATLVSDASGTATTDRLTPGWYKITEVKAPDGYLLDTEEHLVELKENAPAVLELNNQPAKGIVVHKVDGVTKDPLAGAVIELRTIGDELVDTYTSDNSGTITTKKVDPGFYYLVETKSPDGYVLSEEKTMVEVKEGKSPVVTIENFPETIIEVYKTDATTGDPLSGAEFTVTNEDGDIVSTMTTETTGWAYSVTLAPGKYSVTETKAPARYSLDKTAHAVTLRAGQNKTLRLTNTPDTSLHITKINSVTRETIEGAVFEVKKTCGVEPCVIVGEYVTDHNGIAITEPLEPGIYIVTEKSVPDGYVLDETEHEVCVKAGQFNNLVVENMPAATLIVRKIDSKTGKPIAGAVFKVENADRKDLVGTLETDANGEAIFTNLKEGFYLVTETQAPPGYQISSQATQTIHVEYGKNNYCDFKDAQNGSLVVILQDKHTGEYLPGGQFVVTRESDQIVVFDGSTDVTGTIVVGDLIPGWYTVEQVFAPDNYTMADKTTKVEILVGQQQTVYFKDETAGIVIEKVDSTNPDLMLEGARFQVKRDEDGEVIGEYVTDKDGMAMAYGLTPGLYTVTELVAPDGYAIDEAPKTVHVKGGGDAHVAFTDTPLSGITVSVVDKDTRAPLTGCTVEVWVQNGNLVNTYTTDTTGTIQTDKLDAGFYVLKLVHVIDGYVAVESEATVEVKDGVSVTHTFECVSNGILRVVSSTGDDKALTGMRFTVKTIDGTVIGEYTTGKDGTATLPSLTPGWYVISETKAPDGYTIGTAEQRVEITSGKDVTVTFRHEQVFGLQIRTTCQQTGSAVAGAVYQVTELNGAVIGTFTSDKAGIAFVTLTPGWYKVTPLFAPEGYTIPDDSARTIEVKTGGITVTDFVLQQMSSIRVKIVDGNSGRGLYGVRLLVKDGGTAIREFTTDNEGYIYLTNDVLNGNFTLEMISAPDGYPIDTVPKSIRTLVGQTTEIVWKLYTDAGQIQVVVTSADYNKTRDLPAGSLLQGAVFEVMNADTYQVVGQMISDASGVAASSGLPIGRYFVKMVTAPAYYAISDKQVEVRLKINNDVVRTDFQVGSVSLGTEIVQKSNTSIRAGSNMRVDILKANNVSDVRLDNFYLHIKVPTDCARISTLSTGTWNQAVWYSISYHTNMADYRQLAGNLLSTNHYQYDLSTASLGLQAGEYVTDIRFEFGTVPAGFAVVTKSAMSLYVMSTVVNGYKLISRLEIGGQFNTTTVSTNHIDNEWAYSGNGVYDTGSTTSGATSGTGSAAVSGNSGQWTTNTSLWTTTVTNSGNLPGRLPKTGY